MRSPNKFFYKLTSLLAITLLLPNCAAVVAGTAATSMVVAQDRRTTGTIVEDKGIQLKATQAISDIMRDEPKVHVSAICYNNRVLLVGQVPTRQTKAEIERKIKDIDKIKKLHNEIMIKAPTSMMTRSNDSWITTKIKGEMAVTKEFNPIRVKVITEDGIVYLLGIVKKDEENIAVDIARHAKGVKKVVKIFEYE